MRDIETQELLIHAESDVERTLEAMLKDVGSSTFGGEALEALTAKAEALVAKCKLLKRCRRAKQSSGKMPEFKTGEPSAASEILRDHHRSKVVFKPNGKEGA